MMSNAGPPDLHLYQRDDIAPITGDVVAGDTGARAGAPIEFFGDPGHLADCLLRRKP